MTTRIHLVRHGAHDRLDRILCGRMPGVSLNADGLAQARTVGARLAREAIAALVVSPLERARETAQPIGEALGLAAVIEEALTEVDFGEWTGLAFEDLRRHPAWEPWNRRRSQGRPPGGESMAELHARVSAWMEAARAGWPEAAIVAVCHGDVIKAAVCEALGLSLDHHQRLQVDPGSISLIASRTQDWRLLRFNETPDHQPAG